MAERQKLFISCEHGGNRVPQNFKALFTGQEELLRSHRGYDAGALPLAKMLAREMSAPLEKSETTRLLVDLNRSQTSKSLFSEPVQSLPAEEKRQLLESYYLPYRKAVAGTIEDMIAIGAQVVHLSIHSFTPMLDGELRNAELGLLYDSSRSREKQFCDTWRHLLQPRLPDMRIRSNYPYRGSDDGLVRSLRNRFDQQDYLGIELEVNQALLSEKNRFPEFLEGSLLETLQEMFPAD